MSDQEYDLVVIGGGPGGYAAAIKAAQLGLKTVCIEKRGRLGGTCLNVGCIPSKALLQSSEKYVEAQHELKNHGVALGSVKLDLKTMMGRKADVVEKLTDGIAFLFKKYKVDYAIGTGRIVSPTQVDVTDGQDKGKSFKTRNIMIATGSESTPIPNVEVDEKQIVTSTGALELSSVPKHLVVIGGGVIGLEMGSVWSRLGAEVTVIEFLDRITPTMDEEVSKNFKRILEKQGLKFRMKTKVTGAKKSKSGVTLSLEPAAGGDAEELKADVVLLAVGRRPYTQGLGLEDVGVAVSDRGVIQIDHDFRTNIPGIYAIGDAVPGPMLAHKAEDEGIACAEIIAGQKPHINYDAIPSIIYTAPEVASVGKTEQELKAAGVEYSVGKFSMMANSRARANDLTEGFVKIIADKKTDRVLGCHIISADAGTMIHEVVVAMEFGGSAEDIARTCHAHPTLNEAVKEAAMTVGGGKPIHM